MRDDGGTSGSEGRVGEIGMREENSVDRGKVFGVLCGRL
jgi:hypothetical protein